MVQRSKREDVERNRARKSGRPSQSSVAKHVAFPLKRTLLDVRKAQFRNAPKRVRIIGGAWKRSALPVNDVAGLRPTPDRVRETLFNWIEHLVADISTVRGLDLFAGSGALGLELASRGAMHVTLIESNRQLADQLRQVTRRLGADRVDIVAADAMTTAARWPSESFEVIFVDPPYDSGLLTTALSVAARLVTRDGLIYVEHDAPLDHKPPAVFGLQQARSGRAGRVHFHLLRPASA